MVLTLFRKIRKNLIRSSSIRKLDPNKIEGYTLFAFGEIALVVVGILIALQINNWNEWRKDRITEKAILSELKENLEYQKAGIANC